MDTNAQETAVAPLRNPLFRALWTAALVSNVGGWMQSVAAAWQMTSLTSSPILIALVQTAATLPVFLVALPAGALADIVDRRRLLIVMQVWMIGVAGLLGVMTLAGAVTPWLLLGMTFALGLGAAMNAPAWQAIIPEAVSREQLPAAVALNSAGFNVARAVGPALGGIVISAAGVAAGFLLNAVSFFGVLIVIQKWKPPPRVSIAPAERLVGAMRVGLQYARHDTALLAVMVRAGASLVSATAIWALLPLLARERLGMGATGYGVLLGCLGSGAVLGAALLPRLLRFGGPDAVVNGSTLAFALVTAAMAVTLHRITAGAVLLVGGVAWIGLLSTFNTAAQLSTPGWVKARALALYLLVSQGALAIGSAVWGAIAAEAGTPSALLLASIVLAGTVLLTNRFPLPRQKADLLPSRHWPAPEVAMSIEPHDRPVLVTVEYRIPDDRAVPFVRAMSDIRRRRLRDGASNWGLYRDLAEPTRFVESFLVESWAEHLRQHERVTMDDRDVEADARAYHIGPEAPVVSHLLAAPVARAKTGH